MGLLILPRSQAISPSLPLESEAMTHHFGLKNLGKFIFHLFFQTQTALNKMSPTTTTAASVEIVEKTTTFTSSVAAASPTAPNTTKTTKKNYQRKRTDYIWLYNFLLFYIAVGEWFWPQRSSPQDRAYILASCNPLGFTSGYAIWGFWFAVTVSSLYGFTGALW